MECISDKEMLEFLNKEIKSKQKKEISLHISKCKNCQKRLEDWEKVSSVTEEFVEIDKDNILIPEYNFYTFSRETGEKYIWIKHWWKSAAATAAVAVILVAIIFVSSLQKPEDYSQYVVVDAENGSTEAYLFDGYIFTEFQQIMLEEIYQDEELRNEILYGNWENIVDMLTEEDIQFLEEEINKLKKVTKSAKLV
ncbi:MAG: hypothetical protein ISS28_05005 [Candidatus Cloacimonetes bacterium]|nr:hypothetical protein [Candidatus Cloacimonadota bacterium]MBL7086439.1 hypothetical protein [Candidatus Cloacimonadota bacterium]